MWPSQVAGSAGLVGVRPWLRAIPPVCHWASLSGDDARRACGRGMWCRPHGDFGQVVHLSPLGNRDTARLGTWMTCGLMFSWRPWWGPARSRRDSALAPVTLSSSTCCLLGHLLPGVLSPLVSGGDRGTQRSGGLGLCPAGCAHFGPRSHAGPGWALALSPPLWSLPTAGSRVQPGVPC